MSAPEPLASLDRSSTRRGRTVRRAASTSDLTRVPDALVASLVAALTLAIGIALGPPGGHGLSPGPLGRPHAAARLACKSCHDATEDHDARASCTGCHGAHVSIRAGHRQKMAQGQLGCVDCHAAHGTAQGVTFTGDGRFVRWGSGQEETGAGVVGPAGATVPLVTLAACGRCHDLARPTDPVAACSAPSVPGGPPRTSRCFDEHQGSVAPKGAALASSSRVACASQHGPARYAAWDAASQVAVRIPWLSPARGPGPWGALAAAFAAGVVAFASFGGARRLRRAIRRPPSGALPVARAVRALLPRIDASTCLGCYACVDACPFDVLEIQKYVAIVARPADCCGVVLCQQVCPNGSLTIAEGEPIEHRLRLDDHNESLDAPGVFVAGDLSGVPLIKNAIRQGVRAVDRVAETLPRRARTAKDDGEGDVESCDVIIVGAGPAGLSAALRAQELGLSYVCLEQGSIASSVRSFPRSKLVFDQPMNLPVEGDLWLRESTKEELLSQWTRIVRKRKLAVRENRRVCDIARSDGKLVVTAEGGESSPSTFVAPRLILAIGKRGTPRVLECAIDPAAVGKVAYSLADARSFASQRVLIVGLGDSAMEAAIAIARQPGATVTISYRGVDVSRGRARNVAELKGLVARGRVRIVYESRVSSVGASTVTLDAAGSPLELPNDAVLALMGGTPSWDLLQRAGIKAGVVAANEKL